MFKELRGKNIIIRKPQLTDAERSFKWFADPEVTRFLPLAGKGHLPLESIKAHIETVLKAERPELALSIDLRTGEYIGIIGLRNFVERESAEISLVLGEATARGHGIGQEAMKLLLSFGFNSLALKKIWLIVRTDNVKGVSLFRSLGFRVEETLKAAVVVDGVPFDKYQMVLCSIDWRTE